MTSTAHALVAGAIASRFSSPFEASSLALCSHYIMDSIPHWDFGTNWRERPKYMTGVIAIADTIIGISVSYLVFGRLLPFGLWATTVIASLIPDWLETPWYIFYARNNKHTPANNASLLERITYKVYKLPNVFHTKATLPFGIITQIITVGFFIFLLG